MTWGHLIFTLLHTGKTTDVRLVTNPQFHIPCDPVGNPFASVVKYLAFFLCLCSTVILSNSISTCFVLFLKFFSILKCGLHSYTLISQCRFLLIFFFHSIERQPFLSLARTSLNRYQVQQRLIFHFPWQRIRI